MTAAAGQAAQGPTCVACHRPIASTYFAVGDKLVCPDCRDRYAAAFAGGSRFGRLTRAMVFGIAGGVLGALIWFAVARVTQRQFGIIAIVVGLLVGGGVRAGSRSRGGLGYQILAVILAYCSIAGNYLPDAYAVISKAVDERAAPVQPSTTSTASGRETPASGNDGTTANSRQHVHSGSTTPLGRIVIIVGAVVLAMASPFLNGIHNLIGLFIIGFALWEAWRINARRSVTFAGPYTLGTGALGSPATSGGPP